MCSVGDDYQDNELTNHMERLDIIKVKTCNKCREQTPNVLLRRKDGYCRSCFLVGTEHKFKAFLGKHRFIKKDECVLINYTIGHPITALLSFLKSGVDSTTPKQLKFKPVVLCIEKNYHLNCEERSQLLEQIQNHVKEFNFPIYFTSFLEYVCHSNINLTTDYTQIRLNRNDSGEISKLYEKEISLTVQTELCKQYERRLLLESATRLGCQHVFTCDLAVDVASQILTNVSLGRGGHLEMDIGICDKRDPNISLIKPLRVFDIKELALYNYFNHLEPIVITEDQSDPYMSVQNLMTNFVENLQVNFPSTITTVVRTGDKLSMDKNDWENKKCELCLLPIETRNGKFTSAEATEFSHWISTHVSDSDIPTIERADTSRTAHTQANTE
ncbi:hypothetical protein Trydic_g17405 [Trypoxylus dichotomus]